MTTPSSRPGRALLVIDVQIDVVADSHRRDEVVANIARLVERARATEVPVVWVQHSDDGLEKGSPGWQLVPELEIAPGEVRIDKHYRSSFEATRLAEVLMGADVGSLVVCGAQTNFCVRHTVHAALERGFNVELVSDGHTTSDVSWAGFIVPAEVVIDDLNLSCTDYDLPGRTCRAVAAADALL